jgi:flagellar protein FliO/FliZ
MVLTLTTMTALADAPEPPATPLVTRPSRPLTLASANESTPLGYKVVAGAGVALAAALWLRNKKRSTRGATSKSRIDVLTRTSVGVRNELLVVDVEGTRLLLGMTPGSIQTLSVLEIPEEPETPEALEEHEDAPVSEAQVRRRALVQARVAEPPASDLNERVRSLLGARASKARPAAVRGGRPTSQLGRVAGQAKGLMLAMEDDVEAPVRRGHR